MISYQVDKYSRVIDFGEQGVFQRHWEELAFDKVIPWELDHEAYLWLEQNNRLHVVTMLDDDRIVGYSVTFINPHLHYKSAGLMAYEDMYFILPEYRQGGNGARFFIFIEESLRSLGVTKFFLSCKVNHDHSKLFLGLGYKNSDICFSKILNGKQ